MKVSELIYILSLVRQRPADQDILDRFADYLEAAGDNRAWSVQWAEQVTGTRVRRSGVYPSGLPNRGALCKKSQWYCTVGTRGSYHPTEEEALAAFTTYMVGMFPEVQRCACTNQFSWRNDGNCDGCGGLGLVKAPARKHRRRVDVHD